MKYQLFILCCLVSLCLATIPRPRGVAISMASFYRPDVPFRCRDGSKEIPFEYVNDDYCDCPDGTDEPGTSACPGGKFHCTNAGFRPLNILSSRVNDGICDCCDGTDEWDGNIDCVNNCKELGKKMREEADRIRQLQEEGYKLKQKFIEEGKQAKEQKKAELEQLEKNKIELEAVKTEMEGKKTEAEAPEKEAKDKHEQAWNEELERRNAEKERLRAEIAFAELDANKDNKISLSEIKGLSMFDVDSNGEVSDDEAKEHLEGEEEVDQDHFILKVWPNIKQFYKSPDSEEQAKGDNQEVTTEPPEVLPPPLRPGFPRHRNPAVERQRQLFAKRASLPDSPTPHDDVVDDDNDDDDDDDEYEDSEEYEENKTEDNKDQQEEDKMPDYDEATKALIAAADEARQQFNDADAKLKETENQIRDLQSYLGTDYGPNEEYSVLKGNCYEYTDREYTYKLCAFDRATQRPKSGGSETSLGNWGKWDGPGEDKYAAQKYENGQSCWNGPNRSVKVYFKCGTEHKVTSASEPSRCEYAFGFETPTHCTAPPTRSADDVHDEL
ncbi:glucosidase 2 subunit beta-like isoform X2 [Mercenaria mercenaria]|uniref:glucosidase 2 subunit beta-like isoform X2 n=1 Tax=Mercenaria mercenaria TaxID=6596 RepID=UPI00234E963C|nr:glucosidase 2 subunit beta-like isoform X2 [Mercenaria mercenaria]